MAHLPALVERLDLTALSLLPIWWWRDVGERLRAGDAPGRIFDGLLAERWADRPETPAVLRARAAAALRRAVQNGVTPIMWNEPAYPAALAAIIDPPPVLWLRGSAAALERPAVAIVGSRA